MTFKLRISKNFNRKSGFTLIELLIVIALLGALAIGMLATVDPFEQLKKGTDTSTRNTATEVYNAAIRFYSIKSQFPWGGNGAAGTDISSMGLSDPLMTSAPSGYLNQIISAGELKPEFIQLAGGQLNNIWLTSTADVNGIRQNVSTCFLPSSKSFSNDPNAKYNKDGSMGTNCLATAAGGTACFWCLK